MDSATWWRTPAVASAGRRLRPAVWKNSSTALSSNEGELARSITTWAPDTACLPPSPVMVLTPLLGEAASTSWPAWRRMATVFEPIRPVPPMMTIFMVSPPLSTIEGSALADCVLRIGNTGGCRQPWTDFPYPRQRAFRKAVIRQRKIEPRAPTLPQTTGLGRSAFLLYHQ